jgi:cobalt/nickel transport system permease protein
MSRSPFEARPTPGWLARRDPRLRVLAALALVLALVSLQRPVIAALGLALAFVLAVGSGLPARELPRRLLPLEGLLLLLALTLPLTVPGEVLLALGPLSISRQGGALALLILLKANAVVLVLLGLLGGLGAMALGHALARLGLPAALAQLLVLTVRQVELLGQEYQRLRRAMQARAFVPRSNRHTWNSLGWLIGMLLVRSLIRARRLLAAMRCRGFSGRLRLLDAGRWCWADSLACVLVLPVPLALVWLDRGG